MQCLRYFPNIKATFIADKDTKQWKLFQRASALKKHRRFLESDYTCSFLAAKIGKLLRSIV